MESLKIYSHKEKLDEVLHWRESNLLMSDYCKQAGLSLKTLRYWATLERKKARRALGKGSSQFLPVSISPVTEESPSQIIIEYPKGIRITIGGSVCPEYIKALIS